MVEIEVTQDGRNIKTFLNVNPKKFKSGKEGFYVNGTCVIEGVAYRCNFLLYKV